MQRILLKSKIHRVTVTDAELDYEGSLTLDRNLMDAADLFPYEEVHIFNLTNGHRFSTYVIEGGGGSSTSISFDASGDRATGASTMESISKSIIDPRD